MNVSEYAKKTKEMKENAASKVNLKIRKSTHSNEETMFAFFSLSDGLVDMQ